MQLTTGYSGHQQTLIELFAKTFEASEGQEEGARIGDLVHNLLLETPLEDIRVYCAEIENCVIGAAIFTRLTYAFDPHIVFLLSPMAVSPENQKIGIGQALLTHALRALRAEGVQIAITYGDPSYYKQVGFMPITEDQARAPLPLSMPHGWIGQALSEDKMPQLQGPSSCVPALNRSDIW
jgi:putative acetyltransferase